MALPVRTDDRRTKMRMDRKVVQDTAEHAAFGGGGTIVKAPPGFELYSPDKADTYYWRILPYPVTKAGHPDRVRVGDWHYRRQYGIHWDIGGTGIPALCLRDTFLGMTDAVCTRMAELRARGFDENKEAIQAAQSKRNCLFGIIDVKNDPKKVKILDWSYSKFARELEKKLKTVTKPEYLDFAQAVGGWVLKVTIITDSFAGKKFFKVMEGDKFGGPCPGIEFIDAKGFKDLDDSILDQLENLKLDECLQITSVEKIAELFSGNADTSEDATTADSSFGADEAPVAEEKADNAPATPAATEWEEAAPADAGFPETPAADAPVNEELVEPTPKPPKTPATALAKATPPPAQATAPAVGKNPPAAAKKPAKAVSAAKPTADKPDFDAASW